MKSVEIDVYIISYETVDGYHGIEGTYQYLQDAESRLDMQMRPNNIASVTITKRAMKVSV